MADCFERAWRRRFERAAQKYESDHAVSGWSEEGLRRRLATFVEGFEQAALPPGPVALDLGCGAGTYSAWLAARGHRVVALDYSTETLRLAAGRFAHCALRTAHCTLGEAYHLPVATGVIDVVVCVGVFQTLDRPRACLAEIRRVLVSGGRAFVMTLNSRDIAARLGKGVRYLFCGAPSRLPIQPPQPRLLPPAEAVRRAGWRGRQPCAGQVGPSRQPVPDTVSRGYEDLRRYDPGLLRRWFGRAGLRVERVRPVYLMPDRAAALSRVLERQGIYRALGRLGTWPMSLAHAMLFTARAE